jgi:hypothetical protein
MIAVRTDSKSRKREVANIAVPDRQLAFIVGECTFQIQLKIIGMIENESRFRLHARFS